MRLIEEVAADFADRPVKFFVIYTPEAHPRQFRVKQPDTFEERERLAERTRDELGVEGPTILIDDIDNTTTVAYRGFPNKIYVVDKDGKIVLARQWTNGRLLRGFLEDALR